MYIRQNEIDSDGFATTAQFLVCPKLEIYCSCLYLQKGVSTKGFQFIIADKQLSIMRSHSVFLLQEYKLIKVKKSKYVGTYWVKVQTSEYVQFVFKGVNFYRNCGAALVGEYNWVIKYYQLSS